MGDDIIRLVKWKANNLLKKIDKNKENIESKKILEVIEALEEVKKAETKEDIPREIGGVLYFKSVEVEKQLGIKNFSSEFRKIHESLGRDAELEANLTDNEEKLDTHKLREFENFFE